jgi:hypothetical protein
VKKRSRNRNTLAALAVATRALLVFAGLAVTVLGAAFVERAAAR